MPDYLFLMHDDAAALGGDESGGDWGSYIGGLQASGNFQGGGAMGAGVCERKSGAARAVSGHLTGFIRIRADSLDDARRLLVGNPVFEAGGTVEIRELPKAD